MDGHIVRPSMNKPHRKGRSQLKVSKTPNESITFSIRMPHSDLERLHKNADLAGYTLNQFIVTSALGACDMIAHKTKDELPIPKAVSIARYLLRKERDQDNATSADH